MFEPLDPVAYHRDVLPGDLDGPLAAAAAADTAGVAPIALVVDGASWTYRSRDGRVVVDGGVADDARAVVSMSSGAWSDLAQLARTVPALQLAGELRFERGGFGHLARWEPALRALYVGMPIYDPAAADLVDRDGSPLDLHRAFAPDDADDDLRWHLDHVGFLHVRDLLAPAEVDALNDEVDRLAAAARPGDGRSWWATDATGDEVLCRLVYANLGSDRIAALVEDPRLLRLVALSGRDDLLPTLDRSEGVAVLLKSPGELRGLANIPWHVDCGLGGHPVACPSIAIGIQLTDASADAGRFEAIAGSHGQTCRYALDGDLTGLPHVGVDTTAGDVTVHYADVMHASPAPTGAGGRRVLYVTWVNPALFEHVGPGRATNDLVRDRQVAAGALVGAPDDRQ